MQNKAIHSDKVHNSILNTSWLTNDLEKRWIVTKTRCLARKHTMWRDTNIIVKFFIKFFSNNSLVTNVLLHCSLYSTQSDCTSCLNDQRSSYWSYIHVNDKKMHWLNVISCLLFDPKVMPHSKVLLQNNTLKCSFTIP